MEAQRRERAPEPAGLEPDRDATTALPSDPALPGLAWLAARSVSGRTGGLEPVKHRRGRRAVVLERHPDTGAPAIYWKVYATGRGGRLAGWHEELAALDRAGALRFTVPRVLGYWPEARALALRAARGVSVAALAGEALLDACAKCGRALGSLHDSSWRPERRWTTEREAEVLAAACTVLERGAGTLAAEGVALGVEVARRLSEEAPDTHAHGDVPGAGDAVPLHRDFHPGQVLTTGDGPPTLLDWDDAASGPAALDVGNFVAHLLLEGVRRPARAAEWERARASFLMAYAARRGRQAWPLLPVYTAGTLVRLAGLAIARRGDRDEAGRLLEAARVTLDGLPRL